jgi:multicomponent K+:H+ antiporter subunit F
MITAALVFAFGCFGLGLLLNMWWLARGPTAGDRILALDTIALLVLYGISAGTAVFFEASILFAMVGFISTVAYCRYLLRGDAIE